MEASQLETRKFFNTSGKSYREKKLKDRVQTVDRKEAARLISQDPMLLKRPLLVGGGQVLVGFSEKTYEGIK